MIKAIFFDLYGTLVGFHPSRFEIQSAACERFDLYPSPEGILKGSAMKDRISKAIKIAKAIE